MSEISVMLEERILRKLKKSSCYIGTLGAILNDEFISTKGNTTPGIFELFELLIFTPLCVVGSVGPVGCGL